MREFYTQVSDIKLIDSRAMFIRFTPHSVKD